MAQVPSDTITKGFTDDYNAIQRLYADEQIDDCVARARTLIAEPAIPRYHHIRTLLILVGAVPDWMEAWRFLQQAEVLWHLVRRFHAVGEDPKIDKTIEELWDGIVELKEILEDELDDDEEVPADNVENTLAQIDKEAEEAELWQKAEEEADAQALGMTVPQMRAKTASKAAHLVRTMSCE